MATVCFIERRVSSLVIIMDCDSCLSTLETNAIGAFVNFSKKVYFLRFHST